MLQGFQRLDAQLARFERLALILMVMALMGLGVLQVLWRNLLASGLFWVDELLQHLVLWLGLLGASLATRAQRHLSIDLVTRRVPQRWQRRLILAGAHIAVLVCGVLTLAAWTVVHAEYKAGTVLTFGVPTWMAQSIMPLGFAVMVWRFALHGWATYVQTAPAQEPT